MLQSCECLVTKSRPEIFQICRTFSQPFSLSHSPVFSLSLQVSTYQPPTEVELRLREATEFWIVEILFYSLLNTFYRNGRISKWQVDKKNLQYSNFKKLDVLV